MKATQLLHDLGQSIWLDNITRDLLDSGTLKRYIDELSVTGLTSNPTIFDHAIKNSTAYDARDPRETRARANRARRSSSIWRWRTSRGPPTCSGRSTTGPTGWTDGCRWKCRRCWRTTRQSTLAAAKDLFARAARPNLLIKIPGTKEGLPAIEEAIFAGMPINVTLLFSREHYLAAAEAFLRGIERRIDAGLNPDVGSVASVFISRWDAAVMGKVPDALAQPARASPSPSAPTKRTASCSARRAGSASTTPARGRNDSCGPAPGPRTRRPPTFSTSRRSPRRSP